MKKINKLDKLYILDRLSTLFFYLAILLFIIGFNFTDAPPPSGWYQQFMPNIGGKQITDITFLDSLTGIAVANQYPTDSNYVLKTINGGDNWQIIYRQYFPMQHIQFLNLNTGYACAGYLYKTTDGGHSWTQVNTSGISAGNMYVLNSDTIWLTDENSLVGGVFRTTNGGQNWDQQLALGSSNPDHIYMFNGRMGFIAKMNYYVRRTTNGGQNWDTILNNESFTDMYFLDSLNGWKCNYEPDSIKKTTNGGVNWIKLLLPPTGGFFNISAINKFSVINIDTIWGVGARGVTSLGWRGLIYKTINGGQTWGFQLPDSNNINISRYLFTNFINKLNGWAYALTTGVHTVTGGDTITYGGIKKVSAEIPKGYKLYQNYPNPFNISSRFKISIGLYAKDKTPNVQVLVCDITGKQIVIVLDKKLRPGLYEISFDGSNYSTGVYFYSLVVDGKLIDSKKMVLIK